MSTNHEHHGVRHVLDRLQDMAGAVLGNASAAMSGGMSQPFVKNAMLSDLYAMRAGEIAFKRAQSRHVQEIADKASADHTTSTHLLFAALGRCTWDGAHELTPPAELDARRQGFIDHLEAAPDADFEKTHLQQQKAAHDEARTPFPATSLKATIRACAPTPTQSCPASSPTPGSSRAHWRRW